MNWGAGVLILLGVAIVVIGVVGSQKSVCQALTGGDCTWLPGATPTSPSGNSSLTSTSTQSTQQLTLPDPGGTTNTQTMTTSLNTHLLGA